MCNPSDLFKKSPNGYIVSVSEAAFIQIILTAIEAYRVRHLSLNINQRYRYLTTCKKKNKVETHSSLFGNFSRGPKGQSLVRIEFISPETSAIQRQGEVVPQFEALQIKAELTNDFWPHYKRVGSLHTHPYSENFSRDVETEKLYELSDDDLRWLQSSKKGIICIGNCLEMVVAIAEFKKNMNYRGLQLHNHVVRFDAGKYRFWIGAYCCFEDEEYLHTTIEEDVVILDIPSAVGQQFLFNIR